MRMNQPLESSSVAADVLCHGPVRGSDVALGNDEVHAVNQGRDGDDLRYGRRGHA